MQKTHYAVSIYKAGKRRASAIGERRHAEAIKKARVVRNFHETCRNLQR